jgi:hypothetical protein
VSSVSKLYFCFSCSCPLIICGFAENTLFFRNSHRKGAQTGRGMSACPWQSSVVHKEQEICSTELGFVLKMLRKHWSACASVQFGIILLIRKHYLSEPQSASFASKVGTRSLWYFRFLRRRIWSWLSCGILRCVVWVEIYRRLRGPYCFHYHFTYWFSISILERHSPFARQPTIVLSNWLCMKFLTKWRK